ncbi:hypothetical protein [Bradyrhizobium sp. Arg237L]|uniref:hypothetical protein n=1 Tax=Bradyrhizobium sp. Arg237L TaxID=3003352 RepID=UPI0032B79C60
MAASECAALLPEAASDAPAEQQTEVEVLVVPEQRPAAVSGVSGRQPEALAALEQRPAAVSGVSERQPAVLVVPEQRPAAESAVPGQQREAVVLAASAQQPEAVVLVAPEQRPVARTDVQAERRQGAAEAVQAVSAHRPAVPPSVAASAFRPGRLPPSSPLVPRRVARFAHAMRSLLAASPSMRSWQAARGEGLS